ncbi:hypothetical protein BC332_33997 [Capsicum chinense]|nr:hypothetical protein BC332_33997 [Capsicum chinense]
MSILNWNKFGSGSRNLGDLLYLMNGESALKSSALHPSPEYMLQQESHKGILETSGKMPARNPADKVHYIVQGLATYPFSDFGTGRSQNGDYRVEGEEGLLPEGPEPSVRYHSGRARILTLCQDLRAKGQSQVGLRVEHPQELINSIQYSGLANEVQSGRGKVPVADYKVVEYVNTDGITLPSNSAPRNRSCYSFCMCPGGQLVAMFSSLPYRASLFHSYFGLLHLSRGAGGNNLSTPRGFSLDFDIIYLTRFWQVVLTSTDPSELCINGMSFSRRSSKWANAALVVTVSSKDFAALDLHGPLAGVEFQRMFERKAAAMGGGNFVVPVQTVTDFLDNKLSGTSVPSSSYRLGVKATNLRELFPSYITSSLQQSLLKFDKELPGFISSDALLHGVETRTSSPVQISRSADTYECTSLRGLYPIGEGAGYAGGIVSAAVDGMYSGFALAKSLGLFHGSIESVLGKAQSAGFIKY